MRSLGDKKIIISTHVYATGPAQDLREYLLNNKIGKLFFIGHPLFYDKKLKGSGYEFYEKGELKKESYGKIKKNIEILNYVNAILLNIFWIIGTSERWDLFVGSNNLNAFSGIVLRRLGKVKKVIYYVIDYNPKRFKNGLLNFCYQKLDRFCIKHANETWNLSPRMAEARKEYFGFSGGNQKTVPIGIWFERFPRLDFSQIKKHTLVFMGHILEKQGVQYVLEAIPAIIKEIPDFKFLVIGGGEYLEKLINHVKGLRIEKFVEFSGYVEKHEDMERILSGCACAVAMYDKYDKSGTLSFTNFADPGKIKIYLACGLPILLTDVPYNAKEIEEKRCGFVISQDKDEIARKAILLMEDEDTLQEYRENAIEYAKEFDWEVIFRDNLERI